MIPRRPIALKNLSTTSRSVVASCKLTRLFRLFQEEQPSPSNKPAAQAILSDIALLLEVEVGRYLEPVSLLCSLLLQAYAVLLVEVLGHPGGGARLHVLSTLRGFHSSHGETRTLKLHGELGTGAPHDDILRRGGKAGHRGEVVGKVHQFGGLFAVGHEDLTARNNIIRDEQGLACGPQLACGDVGLPYEAPVLREAPDVRRPDELVLDREDLLSIGGESIFVYDRDLGDGRGVGRPDLG